MASKQAAQTTYSALKRWVFQSSGFCKYGLYHDDVLYLYPHIEEALRRVPQDVKDERNYRLSRALHLSMKKIKLPKEEWVTFDEDRQSGRYLQPYIAEVLKEIEEKKEWGQK